MIKHRVTKILSNVLGVAERDIRQDSSSTTMENWDSVRHLDVILALEEEFGVEFDEAAIPELTSVAAIIDRLCDDSKGESL